MPIYDYLCGACGHLLEVIHAIHAEGPRFCPSCGEEGQMRKAMSAPAVVFKGSGWAKKDRTARVSQGKPTGDSSAATAGTSATAAGGSETASSGAGGGSGPGAGRSSGTAASVKGGGD